ncbi:SGNH/GDSL hydrolase family protein [Shewanella electrodiphila]|uniref:SGNH/GDSL hydrolase family protein n=1 Tax=Shewanella electrodiphila TaxID=934143 RepID=A0ABT0KMJ0_9GAMM|nr:SGNH/GDSL hydrolase family protein [Shewanella electrodiphila]MCL1045058.1 SGNH/GDSL hydrolase family protein [Shewanella electrodiphila]
MNIHKMTLGLLCFLLLNLHVVKAESHTQDKSYTFDANKTSELRVREGLPNFFKKLHAGEDVKVGYIGGSITNGGMWRDKSIAWLQSEYPQANISQVNAAIGGTGPDYGAARMGEHLLKHNPDMVFIEYRVNNGGVYQGRAIEGLIPQIWKHNPQAEICIVYTISHWMIEDIAKGNQTQAGKHIEAVANHYGITSIDFGLEVVNLLEGNQLVFKKGDSPTKGKIIFSKDGVHPVESGHDIYQSVLARSLKSIESHGVAGTNSIPEPSQQRIFSNASMVPVNKAIYSNNWHSVPLTGIDIDADLADENRGSKVIFDQAMTTSTVGESFTFEWEGFLLGFTALLEGKGDVLLEVSTDGGKAKLVDMRSRSGKSQEKYKYLAEVEDGKHKTTVKVIKLADNKAFQIGQFLVIAD